MKFSTREDIDAPISTVFAAISDFDHFERQVLRRGADVKRIDKLDGPCVGMRWKTRATIRGRKRDIDSELTEFTPESKLCLSSQVGGVDSALVLELLALSSRRTRLRVALDLTPTNLSARLFVQSLKLAKASLQKRFEDRVVNFAKEVEAREA